MNNNTDMKKLLACFCLGTLLNVTVSAQQFIAEGRLPLAVIPVQTAGVSKPVISLDGAWEINMNPQGEVWKTNEGSWQTIQVPGEPAMQGFKVTNDKEFFYRTTIDIPAAAKNKAVRIRFNGVYSYAKVFVNGHFVRDHHGGFTAWEANLTDHVQPGQKAVIHVGVTDRADDISYASGYAHHPIGGILRQVQLLVLPKDHINRFYVQTVLPDDFKKATLSFNIAKSTKSDGSKVRIQLLDAKGKPIAGTNKLVSVKGGDAKETISFANPVLWNQEQPYLYTVKAELINRAGKTEEVIEQKLGIRKVVVEGKQVLVNGHPVKLRGACRHDMHPLLGRSTNRYYDSLDIVLAKEANINFIRTSHYPPTQDFLEFADKLGMYVQEETAICFANDWREGVYKKYGESYNDTAYTARYLGQLSEMIDRDRNHASIIMWSIGNESTYGTNFQKEYEFVKSVDLSRPVAWSFPGSAINQGKRCFDIAIAHYPAYHGEDTENFGLRYKDMEHDSLPFLGDEWAHVACYNTTILKEDPNVKDFWGRSLDSMWLNRFDVKGNLGGAIWGMTDETFHLPDTVTGYGPWGFIDVWRRKKTEFWNTKKAYSPIRIMKTSFPDAASGQSINIPIKNRYNHIGLDKVVLKIEQNGKTTTHPLPALQPHEEGEIAVKLASANGRLLLRFFDSNNHLIDEELIEAGRPKQKEIVAKQATWTVQENGSDLTLVQKGVKVKIDKATGQLKLASVNGQTVINGAIRFMVNKPKDPGAFKETTGVYSGPFIVENASVDKSAGDKVIVTAKGKVDHYPVVLTTTYHASGVIETAYSADSIPKHTWQIGVAIPVSSTVDAFDWVRKGYWTTYPENHLSAIEGTAVRNTNVVERYRSKPGYGVSKAMQDYYLTGANDAGDAQMPSSEVYRGTKENIISMALKTGNKPVLELQSDGKQAAKMLVKPNNGKQEMQVLDKWDYWALSWGNYAGSENTSTQAKGKVVVYLK